MGDGGETTNSTNGNSGFGVEIGILPNPGQRQSAPSQSTGKQQAGQVIFFALLQHMIFLDNLCLFLLFILHQF